MRYVLFACTHNAGRSPMAQAFFQRHGPADVRAESAGRQPRRGGVWPNVVEAMKEVGIDLSERRPTKLTIEMQLRLRALLPALVDEFAGLRSDAEIRTCADAILETFADAPIRSHVITLAHRRTRDCLRSEYCDALAPGGR